MNAWRSESMHLQLRRHIQGHIADLEICGDFADECRRFSNSPSKRKAVGLVRDTCLELRCRYELGRRKWGSPRVGIVVITLPMFCSITKHISTYTRYPRIS